MSENKPTKSKINLICAILALVCLAAMFVPIGEERVRGGYGDSVSRGELPYTIAQATSGFNSGETVYALMMFLVCAAAILLLIWTLWSFSKGSHKGAMGLVAAIVNLVATAFMTLWCLSGAYDGRVFLPVILGLAALAVAALVLAILQRKASR